MSVHTDLQSMKIVQSVSISTLCFFGHFTQPHFRDFFMTNNFSSIITKLSFHLSFSYLRELLRMCFRCIPLPMNLGQKPKKGVCTNHVKKCGSGVAHRTTILNNGYVFSKSFYIGEGVKIHQNNVHVICTWPHRSEKSIQKADGCIKNNKKRTISVHFWSVCRCVR